MLVEVSTPYTPNQDGRSERAIRIILDRARSATIDQNIPEFLWPFILEAMVYVTNRTATSLLEGKTPLQYLMDHIKPEGNHV